MQTNKMKNNKRIQLHQVGIFSRLLCWLMVFVLTLTACRSKRTQDLGWAKSDYGAEIAKRLTDLGARPAGSSACKQAADIINEEFQKLGYQPELQAVSGLGDNVIVKIPGYGLRYNRKDYSKARKLALGKHLGQREGAAIVMARYTTVSGENVTEANGLSDNAASIGALLTLAKQLKTQKIGYDVVLVALCSNQTEGAQTLLNSLSAAEKEHLSVVYELRNIFGGSRLYAHSGWNSLNKEEKYQRRLPVYQIVDLALEAGLGSKHSPFESIYTNQAGFMVASPLNKAENVVYREFTLNTSDYRVFDEAGIDTVYIESWNYFGKNLEEIKQTDSRLYAESNGLIAGTNFDNYTKLLENSSAEQLSKRINSSAFIVLKALYKGALDSQPNTLNY